MLKVAEVAGERHALETSGSALTGAGNGEQAGEQVLSALRAAQSVLASLIDPKPGASSKIIFFQAVEAEAKARHAIALASGGKA